MALCVIFSAVLFLETGALQVKLSIPYPVFELKFNVV